MSTSTHYDVIISSTGTGGGTLAYKLASSEKNIRLLERSSSLRRFEARKPKALKYKMLPPSSLIISSGMGAD
ncbi:MAG: hypothetical protein AAB177_09035 [Nitrospirota bacterium]